MGLESMGVLFFVCLCKAHKRKCKLEFSVTSCDHKRVHFLFTNVQFTLGKQEGRGSWSFKTNPSPSYSSREVLNSERSQRTVVGYLVTLCNSETMLMKLTLDWRMELVVSWQELAIESTEDLGIWIERCLGRSRRDLVICGLLGLPQVERCFSFRVSGQKRRYAGCFLTFLF